MSKGRGDFLWDKKHPLSTKSLRKQSQWWRNRRRDPVMDYLACVRHLFRSIILLKSGATVKGPRWGAVLLSSSPNVRPRPLQLPSLTGNQKAKGWTHRGADSMCCLVRAESSQKILIWPFGLHLLSRFVNITAHCWLSAFRWMTACLFVDCWLYSYSSFNPLHEATSKKRRRYQSYCDLNTFYFALWCDVGLLLPVISQTLEVFILVYQQQTFLPAPVWSFYFSLTSSLVVWCFRPFISVFLKGFKYLSDKAKNSHILC